MHKLPQFLMTALVERGGRDFPRAGIVRLNDDGTLAPVVVAQVRDDNMPGHDDMTGQTCSKHCSDIWPTRWSRRHAVARHKDPDNIFRINQNIPPAGG